MGAALSKSLEDFLTENPPTEEQVAEDLSTRRDLVLWFIPWKEPGISLMDLHILLKEGHEDLVLARDTDPDADLKIPYLHGTIRKQQMALNSVTAYLRDKELIRVLPNGHFVRRDPTDPPGGSLVAVVDEFTQEQAQRKVRARTLPPKVKSPVQHRKTARDVELEDHLRLHPTNPITADSLIYYFAIEGVKDPKNTATQRLARLALLGVVKRVGPSNSGVYTLLPESSS